MNKKISKSPPGWGGTVEKMKEHPEISNPFSLAWWMSKKEKGDEWGAGGKLKKKPKPHVKEKKKKSSGESIIASVLKHASFKDVVKQTWNASGRNEDKFRDVIEPFLEKLNKQHLDAKDIQEYRDAISEGTDQVVKFVYTPIKGFEIQVI